FREEGVDLEGLWGLGIGQGSAQIFIVPKDPALLKSAIAKKSDWKCAEGTCFRVSAPDEVGALATMLDSIADAGINLQGVDAVALSGEVACYVWPTENNADKLEELLKSL
ncbi:MAG: hypothetical protein KDD66_18225, partial [Bdellovibrionales bacterium]|nr:hypothetical protein [Bdellovibrionales bacterium]